MPKHQVIVLLAAVLASCATDGLRYRVGERPSPNTHSTAQGIHYTEVEPLGKVGELDAPLSKVGELDAPLKVVSAPLPAYPPELRMANMGGSIKVRFYIEADGSSSNPMIVGNPAAALVAIALETIMHWRFGPITRGGKPVRVQAEQEFVFAME